MWIFRLFLCFFFISAANAKPVSVAFFTDKQGTSPYWDGVLSPVSEVARQLDLDLRIYHTDKYATNRDYEKVEALLKSADKPDFLITGFFSSSSLPLLELIEKYRVPFISIATGVPAFERQKIRKPKQRYKYWLAHVTSDDFSSGQMLMENLARIARERFAKEKINVLAIGSDNVLETSAARQDGLMSVVAKDKNLSMLRHVYSHWRVDKAQELTRKVLSYAKSVDIIWAINDEIALGAYNGVLDTSDIITMMPIIGGVDATIEGLKAIKEGRLDFSLGGNNMYGAWALIMVYDFVHGVKLSQGERSIKTPYFYVDKSNASNLLHFLENELWHRVDFKRFSRYEYPTMGAYDFDAKKIFSQQFSLKEQNDYSSVSYSNLNLRNDK